MPVYTVSQKMLEWTADRLGSTVGQMASDLASTSKRDQFKSGELTLTQVREIARRAGVPFGYLFLDEPPLIRPPEIPDLRQTAQPEPLGREFHDVYDDVRRMRGWYEDYLTAIGGEGPDFIGKYALLNADAKVVAADISSTLKLGAKARANCSTYEAYFSYLSEQIEATGVLVFRSGVVRGNTHREIPVSQFRGFAIAEGPVPVVFVNGKDAQAAWIFTLIHEVVHIWLGSSGVSDVSASHVSQYEGLEAFCNRVAAEVLTPEAEFLNAWSLAGEAPVHALSRIFKVSRLVVARRALDLKRIGFEEYKTFAQASMKQPASSGGDIYLNLPIRSSRKLTRALVSSAVAGEVTLRDAARLLHVSPDTVVQLARRLRATG